MEFHWNDQQRIAIVNCIQPTYVVFTKNVDFVVLLGVWMCAIVLQILIRASCMQRGAYICKNRLLRKVLKNVDISKSGKSWWDRARGWGFLPGHFLSLRSDCSGRPCVKCCLFYLMSKLFQSYALNQFAGFIFLHWQYFSSIGSASPFLSSGPIKVGRICSWSMDSWSANSWAYFVWRFSGWWTYF